MSTMMTFQAGRIARLALLAALCACSSEQQDWRSAEGADTSEAWSRFIEQHPDSELAAQARARIAQLAEELDWQHASALATAQGYRQFLGHHASGSHAEEARIRIEAFALGSAPRTTPQTPEEVAAGSPSGVNALQLSTIAAPPSHQSAAQPSAAQPSAAGPSASQQDPPQENPGRQGVADAAAPGPTRVAVAQLARDGEPSPADYAVQLGAFGSEASAGREWQRLQGRFGAQLQGLSPRIVVASSDGSELYRLQAPASGEAQARAICNSLKEQDQACVPVLPR
jgi:cell division septation protein DedD